MTHLSQIDAIDDEIASIDTTISILKEERAELVERKTKIQDTIAKRTLYDQQSIEYDQPVFDWSDRLFELARSYFDIHSFRSLQLPILNAALDQKRDLFVVLPTGGGKSLCYQLPALMEDGFTLVISPLISLIKDQVYQLNEANVPAAYLIGSSTKEDVNDVQANMLPVNGANTTALKLLYVTPEKIAGSKRFMSRLSKSYEAGMLTRIVVDEAHCCSQQGHDFRKDYIKLNILRTVFPDVKIMALTATCPWSVMKDVMEILQMKKPQVTNGTLLFSAPLYRPNLHYSVAQRPDSESDTIRHIVDWILETYPNQSGIIYCLSRKDTETVANSIYKESRGKVKCGAYHAEMDEEDKEMIHKRWRAGQLHVIVATIAFGMGINHLKTRFVIHHSMPKSMEGYYQESGRAGRDGEKAQCIIYYRGSDVMRLLALVVGEMNGPNGLYKMAGYAQDYTSCRKILFENYFSLLDSKAEGLVNKITPDQPCGICDNCTRNKDNVMVENIHSEAESIIKLCSLIIGYEGRESSMNKGVTMNKLVEMLQGRDLGPIKSKVLADNSGFNIPFQRSKYDIERIITCLLAEGYLGIKTNINVYKTLVYIIVGRFGHAVITNPNLVIDSTFLGSSFKSNKSSSSRNINNSSNSTTKRRKITNSSPEIITLDDD